MNVSRMKYDDLVKELAEILASVENGTPASPELQERFSELSEEFLDRD